ncbi:MAG: hypothetical protein JWN03_6143 [Nocardia sp.]|nr:hypothetical protein [Nocardia sp.]
MQTNAEQQPNPNPATANNLTAPTTPMAHTPDLDLKPELIKAGLIYTSRVGAWLTIRVIEWWLNHTQ